MRQMLKDFVDDYTINGKAGFSGYVFMGWTIVAVILMSPFILPFALIGWLVKRISQEIK